MVKAEMWFLSNVQYRGEEYNTCMSTLKIAIQGKMC